MADIRIKDLATTASSTAADDFLAVDGTTNGTRKLSAATPSFATSVTVPGVAGPTATNLTLAGGSTGASLVLGQGASKAITLTTGSGNLNISGGKVGIGASSPLAPLSVQQTGTAPSGYASATNSGITVDFGVNDNGVINLVGGGQLGIYHSNSSNAYDVGIDFGNNADRIVKILTANAERARITSTGNLLIGTTTDSGNGKLQLATHTTSAGGIGFGTDLSLNRVGPGVFRFDHLGGSFCQVVLAENNVQKGQIQTFSGDVYVDTLTAGKSLYLRSGNATTALTLASNQAATFAGAVTTGSTLTVGANIEMPAASSIRFNSGTGLIYTGGYSYALSLQGSQLNLNTLSNAPITTGTGLATFAGAVAINNTVATAVAVASTHKVTMVIGGVTYYLLASNV